MVFAVSCSLLLSLWLSLSLLSGFVATEKWGDERRNQSSIDFDNYNEDSTINELLKTTSTTTTTTTKTMTTKNDDNPDWEWETGPGRLPFEKGAETRICFSFFDEFARWSFSENCGTNSIVCMFDRGQIMGFVPCRVSVLLWRIFVIVWGKKSCLRWLLHSDVHCVLLSLLLSISSTLCLSARACFALFLFIF